MQGDLPDAPGTRSEGIWWITIRAVLTVQPDMVKSLTGSTRAQGGTSGSPHVLPSRSEPVSRSARPLRARWQRLSESTHALRARSNPVSQSARPLRARWQRLSESTHALWARSNPVSRSARPLRARWQRLSESTHALRARWQPLSESVHALRARPDPVSRSARPLRARWQPLSKSTHALPSRSEPVSRSTHVLCSRLHLVTRSKPLQCKRLRRFMRSRHVSRLQSAPSASLHPALRRQSPPAGGSFRVYPLWMATGPCSRLVARRTGPTKYSIRSPTMIQAMIRSCFTQPRSAASRGGRTGPEALLDGKHAESFTEDVVRQVRHLLGIKIRRQFRFDGASFQAPLSRTRLAPDHHVVGVDVAVD